MKEKKDNMVGVKLSDTQLAVIDQMVDGKIIKNRGQAIKALINKKIILG